MEKEQLTINREYITLGQFLKMTDIISSGGMAKAYLQMMPVLLNGEEERRRGKKLYPGDEIVVSNVGTFVIVQDHVSD
ncbi:S4 domain-containing protein YaaA [Allofustis seminis]|uniref:S4 domain-containing protein YaaA n=1 Tax=Allofustis seminis TaxID=166939 RepID=UPI000378044B|nr:S4 domain-containing protein YaaA [Allofustis seminis]